MNKLIGILVLGTLFYILSSSSANVMFLPKSATDPFANGTYYDDTSGLNETTELWNETLSKLFERFAQVCPNQRCSAEGSIQNPPGLNSRNSSSCCAPCSCDNTCLMFDTCCPDAFGSAVSNSKASACYRTYYEPPGIQMKLHSHPSRYSLIYRCSKQNTKVQEKCQLSRPKAIGDQTVVYSNLTNALYKNKYCAECNRVTVYESWRLLAIECRLNLYEMSVHLSYFHQRVLENCITLSEPWQGMDIRRFDCSLRGDGRTCNVTGEWDVYNRELFQGCGKGGVNPVTVGDTTYPNPYCYLCNVPSTMSEPAQCTVPSYKPTDYGTNGPVYDLLDATDETIGEVFQDAQHHSCLKRQFFDPLMDTCRPFLCPYNSLRDTKRCVKTPIRVHDKVYLMSVHLDPLSDTVTDVIDFEKTKHKMVESFLQNEVSLNPRGFMLELLKSLAVPSHCKVFDSSVIGLTKEHSANKFTGLAISYRVLSTAECNDDFLHKCSLSSGIFSYRQGSYQLNVTLYRPNLQVTDVQQNSHFKEITLVPFSQNLLNKLGVLAPIRNCPHVYLNTTQLYKLSGRFSTQPFSPRAKMFLTTVKNARNEEHYCICIKDYLALLTDSSLQISETQSKLDTSTCSSFCLHNTVIVLTLIVWFAFFIIKT